MNMQKSLSFERTFSDTKEHLRHALFLDINCSKSKDYQIHWQLDAIPDDNLV